MELESSKNIFMGLKAPTQRSVLVSIPMDMYRIQTCNFKAGLNFFKKAVLKFKLMPSITNERIAELLDIDVKLVNRIEKDLRKDDYLDEYGYLTEQGAKARAEADALIVDENSQPKMGYIFKYEGGNTLFPYYQAKVDFSETDGQKLFYVNSEKTKEIIFSSPFQRNDIEGDTRPNEQEIFRAIRSSCNQRSENSDTDIDIDVRSLKSLKITFVHDAAQKVNVFTYIYLPLAEDSGEEEIYQDDWQVLDPFGFGNSIELKNYLQTEYRKNKQFKNCLSEAFGTADTENHQKYVDSEAFIEKQAIEEMVAQFGPNILTVDQNLSLYIKYLISDKIKMDYTGYRRINLSENFSINLQKVLEVLLKVEQQDREDTFFDLYANYTVEPLRPGAKGKEREDWLKEEQTAIEQRQADLGIVLKEHVLFTCSNRTAKVLRNKCKSKWGQDSSKDSLLDVYLKFLLSFYLGNPEDSKIYEVMSDVNLVFEISQIRNKGGHGDVFDEENPLTALNKEDVERYYSFFVRAINDYIN